MSNRDLINGFQAFCCEDNKNNGLSDIFSSALNDKKKISCAQNFEDIYLSRIFGLDIDLFYVDVGASHPWFSSVTSLFYYHGSRGINIDADPRSIELLNKYREEDKNILALVSDKPEIELPFYLHSKQSRSTANTSYLDSDLFKTDDFEILNHKSRTLNDILCTANCPKDFEFLKIDVEGHEQKVLASLDLSYYNPAILIIETHPPYDMADSKKNQIGNSSNSIDNHLTGFDYSPCFNDGINTWFCKSNLVKSIKQILSRPISVIDSYLSLTSLEAMLRYSEFYRIYEKS